MSFPTLTDSPLLTGAAPPEDLIDLLGLVPLMQGGGWISGNGYWLSKQSMPHTLTGIPVDGAISKRLLDRIAAGERSMRDADTPVRFGPPYVGVGGDDDGRLRAIVLVNDRDSGWAINPNYVTWLEHQHGHGDWKLGTMPARNAGPVPAYFLVVNGEMKAIVAPVRRS